MQAAMHNPSSANCGSPYKGKNLGMQDFFATVIDSEYVLQMFPLFHKREECKCRHVTQK
jgi:hypothetical protein